MSVTLNLTDEEAKQLAADYEGIVTTAAASEMDEERQAILEKTKRGLSENEVKPE